MGKKRFEGAGCQCNEPVWMTLSWDMRSFLHLSPWSCDRPWSVLFKTQAYSVITVKSLSHLVLHSVHSSSLRSIQTETTGRGRKEGSSSLPPPPCPVTGRHVRHGAASGATLAEEWVGDEAAASLSTSLSLPATPAANRRAVQRRAAPPPPLYTELFLVSCKSNYF